MSRTSVSTIRCAIYTRKSTEEGLEQEFNSLDAQRESAEAYIASQKTEGWVALPDRYDDGGYSGGSMERPALDRLMRDISNGKIDCVVVYKVDRLSRSLMDFARIMGTFDQHHVSFVSVTQHFNTTHSMGRLTLNILLSFAQFEREIISERIRDKLAAQARKGKWTGGAPVLGYDVDRSGPSPRLIVNPIEAARVRNIFRMYLQEASLLPVVKELNRRGWLTKRTMTSKERQRGNSAFNKARLHRLLTNPTYVGKRRFKGEIFPAEHEALIEQAQFDKVQQQLKANGSSGGTEVRNKYGALLRGLLRCKGCDSAMTHTFTQGKGKNAHRYYRCVHAIKNGRDACSSGTLPAAEIERVVVEEVRGLARDPVLFSQVLADAQATIDGELAVLRRERDELRQTIARDHKALQRLATSSQEATGITRQIADVNDRLATAERRLPELDVKIAELRKQIITPHEARTLFADFDSLWKSLIPREQARLLKLLIATVEYDGKAATVSVTFRPTSIRSLVDRQLENAA